jgi:uncharacterized membrane protein YedE/YeeE
MILAYFALGGCFGLVLVKAEIVSWLRIQEMFRFQGFHMYGVLGSAVLVTAIGLAWMKRRGSRSLTGETILVPPKDLGAGTRYWLGGAIFGIGWALTGACPGPLFALVGAGLPVMLASVAAALAGTWLYGRLRSRLPH